MKYRFWLLGIIVILTMFGILYSIFVPNQTELTYKIISLIFLGITTYILIGTLHTYKELTTISQETLSFTKKQSSFNSYFDNYKLFNELSKRKTDVLFEGELIFSDQIKYFENMTFENIHFNYMEILKNFPVETINMKFELVFKKFNHKIQSFINTLFNEISRILSDENLSNEQKNILTDLYENFVLNDYYNLSQDLIKNKEWFDSDLLPPIEISNLLKCNSNNRNIFDVMDFLKLYYLLEKDTK